MTPAAHRRMVGSYATFVSDRHGEAVGLLVSGPVVWHDRCNRYLAMKIEVPELGENVDDAEVIRIMVSEGDQIEEDQPIVELQTDKASTEMPSPAAGRVTAICVSEGDTVAPGQVVLELDTGGGEAESEDERTGTKRRQSESAEEPETDERESGRDEPEESEPDREEKTASRQQHRAPGRAGHKTKSPPVPAGPATRRFAREAGVDLRRVAEDSKGKRVTREDVKAYLRTHGSRRQEARREPLSRIRRKSAERLSKSWREVPHVTHHDEADVTDLDRGRRGLRELEPELPLTMTSIVAKVVALTLRKLPRFNASFDEEAGDLVIHPSVDLGIAVDTDDGLLVPVVRDADQKSTRDLALEIAKLADRARSGDLSADELSGSTFSITNLGGIGGTGFSPIVNPPEVAILGLSRTRQSLVLDSDGMAQQRLILPLSLSYDHRAIDGAAAARFVRTLARLLQEPVAIVLES